MWVVWNPFRLQKNYFPEFFIYSTTSSELADGERMNPFRFHLKSSQNDSAKLVYPVPGFLFDMMKVNLNAKFIFKMARQ